MCGKYLTARQAQSQDTREKAKKTTDIPEAQQTRRYGRKEGVQVGVQIFGTSCPFQHGNKMKKCRVMERGVGVFFFCPGHDGIATQYYAEKRRSVEDKCRVHKCSFKGVFLSDMDGQRAKNPSDDKC
jgi:hypothetical protein